MKKDHIGSGVQIPCKSAAGGFTVQTLVYAVGGFRHWCRQIQTPYSWPSVASCSCPAPSISSQVINPGTAGQAHWGEYSTVQYSTVQYSIVLYSTVQYSTVQYSIYTVQYSTVQYSIVQYSTVQYSTVQYSTVQYSTVQYCIVQYITVQYSTVQYSTVKYSTVPYSTVQYSTVQCTLAGILPLWRPGMWQGKTEFLARIHWLIGPGHPCYLWPPACSQNWSILEIWNDIFSRNNVLPF